MSLEVTVLDSIESADRNQWNHVVETAPLGSLFHRYEWLEALEAGTASTPRHLVVHKKGNPVGLLPNVITDVGPVSRLDSLYPGFGGPIAITDEEAVLEALLGVVPRLCDGTVLFSRLRTYDQAAIRYHELFRAHGYDLDVKWCRIALELSQGWEAVSAAMDRTRRRGIRRGHDQAFEIVDVPISRHALARFYDAYAAVMERSGLPVLPYSFFLALEHLDDRLELFSLRVDGEARGSILCYRDDEQSTLHYAYSGVKREHFEYHAAELLHEHAIKWAIEHGYDTYDLLRTAPDFRDGLFRFKSQFGGRVVPLLSWERGVPSPALPVLNLARSLQRRYLD
ncbi:GNAT family N-acetyltransferase [Natronobeatus ordinarius]|uniref:GNAT family N-acetyltransferase n=1 Tax=Natronobeatus ordinarius TaxID=2963433 RepID=UPI0020CBCE28|nr:GNAT family N-acetyltransferase [Natronobeatus ordinarius]